MLLKSKILKALAFKIFDFNSEALDCNPLPDKNVVFVRRGISNHDCHPLLCAAKQRILLLVSYAFKIEDFKSILLVKIEDFKSSLAQPSCASCSFQIFDFNKP